MYSLFSCFKEMFQAAKANIFGNSNNNNNINTDQMQQQQIYNIEKKGSKGEHLYLTPKEKHTHTLIFMHGLGDTANGYLDIFTSKINPVTPSTKVVLLTAPIRKVTINFGMESTSWFDFKNFEVTTENFHQAIGFDEVQESTKVIHAVLEEEIKILGDSKKVFIGGFSQGACMSLFAGLTYKQQLGAIFAFSGFLFPVTQETEANKNTPILISHGKQDALLPWNRCELSYKKFNGSAHQIRWEIFDDLDHGFNEQSFLVFKDFYSNNAKL